MAAFRRRTSKTADESQTVENETESQETSVEQTTPAEEPAASLEVPVSETETASSETTEEAKPKKRKAIVKKSTSSADQPKKKTAAVQQNQQTNRKFSGNNRTFTRNIPQEAMQVETHLPEGMTTENGEQPRLEINELTKKGMQELRELAVQYGFTADDLAPMKKQDLIFVILKAHTEHGGIIYASGSLEILPDGYGFLRSPQNSYLPGPDDIYISPSQIRLFNLKTGDTVYGQTRSPKEGEKFFALLRIESVNFDEPRVAQTRVPFENLTPLYPNEKLKLETVST